MAATPERPLFGAALLRLQSCYERGYARDGDWKAA